MRNYFLAAIALLLCNTFSSAQNSRQRDIDAFTSQTGAIATTDKATNSLSFLRFPIGQSLVLEGNSPEQKAIAFLNKYPGLFEKKAERISYQVKENKRDNYGLDHVTMQQYYDRVPIFDGVLKFHFNKEGGLTSLNGNFIIAGKLNATPSISSEEAGQQAIKLVTGQKTGKFSAPLKINKNKLLVFQKGLAQGYKGALHLVYEVEVRNDADVREFLYIDAHTKELVEQFTGMHSIDRKLYENSVLAQNLKWKEADGIGGAVFAGLDQWQKSEVESAGHIYNLMKNAFGQNSYDNAGAAMITINNNPNVNCPNATWNGVSANYCTGVASDDIVAHEWAHAYTEYTSGLIYAWQAGALNEAYSDIWGETVDQLNGYFDNGESNALRNGCASSAKWRIGEQASAFGGAIRDMWDPNCTDNPGKVSDPQYWCLDWDGGGVHSNSGVLNHAYALLVDGGAYNGQIITGLGITKAAHIFWRAQSTYMTSTTDFSSQADILEASLTDLIGIDLANIATSTLNGGVSGLKITADDLNQLKKVLLATEMRTENGCGFEALFKPAPPMCKGGSAESAFFYENFENGLGLWTATNTGSSPTWTARNWVVNSAPPAGRPGKVAYAENLKGGDCGGTILQNGLMSLESPNITIPADASGVLMMAFDHYISLESGYDGGNISFKIGNGNWTLIPKFAFIENPYNLTLASNYGNPLGGQPAFSGGNAGSLTSDWGQSRIDLSSLGITSGQNVRFRWDLGSDECDGWGGWNIDDVRIYSCEIPTVQFLSENTSVSEGEANTLNAAPNQCLPYVEKYITVKINKAPSQPVTVTFNTPAGTATQGVTADYTIVPLSFVLHSDALTKDVIVRVYNDVYSENTETVILAYTLSSPASGNAGPETFNQQHTLSILDNDHDPGITSKEFINENFSNDWPQGWQTIGEPGLPDNWFVGSLNDKELDHNDPPLLYISSDLNGPGLMDKFMESPPFNTSGMTAIEVIFQEFFQAYFGFNDFDEQANIEVWDGNSWQIILAQNEISGSSGSWILPRKRKINIPIQFANPAMKIRFHYIANGDYGWAIDNLVVTGIYTDNIQTTISQTPDSQYLGPNSTVYFRDPASGDLIAKIKNLTAHDYGCTSVQVDRAGIDETAWIGTKKITKKTFNVTPTNPNPNGNYEITLYYKASELAGFNGADIKSMGKSEGGIQQATVANSMTAPVQMAMFNSDYAYTATFNSGFSGFGLSDAAAGSALPVTLSRFEGKNTLEGNILSWETSTEVNNDHFIVERSADAETFKAITKMDGVGNSAITNSYSFIDNTFTNKVNYYRLKQVDADGAFAYSRMIAIDAPGKKEVKYFPNPVQSTLSIEIPESGAVMASVSVINTSGQIVLKKEKVKCQKGKLSLDLSKLVAGSYQVIVATENGNYNASVVKAP